MKVKVLGSAAGGGFPQWNCGCSNCSRLRRGVFRGKARTQAQLAVSPDDATWFLLNASPDLKQQLLAHPEFAPSEKSRNTPVAAIVLTSADVDCVLGLLHLREFQPLRIYSTLAVKRALTEENRLFQTLTRSNPPVRWEQVPLDRLVPLFQPAGPAKKTSLFCKAVPLNGAYPDYLSDALRRAFSMPPAWPAAAKTGGGASAKVIWRSSTAHSGPTTSCQRCKAAARRRGRWATCRFPAPAVS